MGPASSPLWSLWRALEQVVSLWSLTLPARDGRRLDVMLKASMSSSADVRGSWQAPVRTMDAPDNALLVPQALSGWWSSHQQLFLWLA